MASGIVVQQHARDLISLPSSKFQIPDIAETETITTTPTTTTTTTTTTTAINPLLNLLTNSLVLHQTIPYLPISSLLNLAATSPAFRDLLLCRTPGVFRHLDLTRVKNAQFDGGDGGIDHGGEIWRNVQVDENLTEDDFYSGPLRGIFQGLRRRDILRHVQTLILDGLSVTAEFCNDVLVDPALRVRILSIRDVKNLNERKLMQSLRYACRPSRPDDTPRLKGLYVFGVKDAPTAVTASTTHTRLNGAARGTNISIDWNHKSQNALKESIRSEGDDWYHKKGRIINKHIADGWAETLLDCREVIKFDAVLCTGPRHQNSPVFGKIPATPSKTATGNESRWAVATFALGGCASCGSSPEGYTVYGDSPAEDLPLLAPVPLHSSTIKAATCPKPTLGSEAGTESHKFVPRCLECIRERYCFSCDQWWCESCYQVPSRHEINAQHVHVVDQTNGMVVHEMAALEQPHLKVRMGYCLNCNLRSMERRPGNNRNPFPLSPS
ncbi:uncharacterized protein F4822DRAFT_303145 [Hypoxylon trugodes]|uniref:uncharacterized protein n=1 Tax=Hypoxylon trugodes TaxID=326681 RepID=UPI0021943F81|nr:uncharacterized protein F4822DRAFT_303145 [Hypoxylon trugodes]KAI1388129.1 hypothetical protein F4822DRAFT_303145 [Hypoxylon trugodes]